MFDLGGLFGGGELWYNGCHERTDTMALPQRDDLIEEIKRTDALLEWAVMHGEEAEAERLRAQLRSLASMGEPGECKPVWDGKN